MRVQLPDGRIAEFPDGMSRDEVLQVMRQKFKPKAAQSVFDKYVAAPFALGLGGGIVERGKGIQQAFSDQSGQERIGGEIAAMRAQREAKGWPTEAAAVVGRDILGPVAATIGFANPLSIGALGAAGASGAGMGATNPSEGYQDAWTRALNAVTGGALAIGGQTIGGVVGRAIERPFAGAVSEASRQAATAGGRVADDVLAAADEAGTQVDEAWNLVRQQAEGKTIPNKEVNAVMQRLMDAQAKLTNNDSAGVVDRILSRWNRFIDAGQEIPANELIGARQTLSKASVKDGGLRGPVNEIEGVLKNNLGVKGLDDALGKSRNYYARFMENPFVRRVVNLGDEATGEEVAMAATGAGTGVGNRAAGRKFDSFVQAGAKPSDIGQSTVYNAFVEGGKTPIGTGQQIVKLVDKNRTLAEKVFSPDDIAAGARAANQASRSGAAANIGASALGLGGVGSAVYGQTANPNAQDVGAFSTPLLVAAGILGGGKYAAGQYADDAAALAMQSVLSRIGVIPNIPRLFARGAAGVGGGAGGSVGSRAFERQKKRVRVDIGKRK